ncbi:tol-pal system protein YbgF [Oleidesulfovibrio alaskensis]
MNVRQSVALALCVVAATVLAGCAPRGGDTVAASSEWRLQNLEANQLEMQEKDRAAGAEMRSRLQALENRLERLEKKLEDTGSMNAAAQADAEARKAAENAKQYASTAPAPAPAPVAAPQQSPVQAAGHAVSAKKAPASQPADETARYQAGVKAVMNEDVKTGRSILEAFLADFPKSGLAPNASYWLGETYYHEKRYAEAILTFKEVVRNYPKHEKAAAAMLKTGYAYEMLGDKSNARFYLQTLVDEYSASEPAALARKRLKSL